MTLFQALKDFSITLISASVVGVFLRRYQERQVFFFIDKLKKFLIRR